MSSPERGASFRDLTVGAFVDQLASAESLVGRSNPNAASDLDVATLLGEAAARGAAANVLINLPSVDDETYVGEATDRVMRLLDSIEEISASAHAQVRSGGSRDPIPA